MWSAMGVRIDQRLDRPARESLPFGGNAARGFWMRAGVDGDVTAVHLNHRQVSQVEVDRAVNVLERIDARVELRRKIAPGWTRPGEGGFLSESEQLPNSEGRSRRLAMGVDCTWTGSRRLAGGGLSACPVLLVESGCQGSSTASRRRIMLLPLPPLFKPMTTLLLLHAFIALAALVEHAQSA